MMSAPRGLIPFRSPRVSWASVISIVLLILAVLLIYSRLIFEGLVLAGFDTQTYFYPYWTYTFDSLQQGRVPLWNPNLFTGEFWSGAKSKELGLVDGLGNADEVLREKFGEDVEIKKFEKSKGWLSKKISGNTENQIETLIQLLEERSIWQKYGL